MILGRLIVGLGVFASLAQEGYERVREVDGVSVYRRSGVKAIELGAEGRIEAPPGVVRAVLTDYANHPRWVHYLAESRVLAADEGLVDVYQRLGLPAISDRDFTIHVTWGDAGEMTWLRFATANEHGPPPVRGVVRVAVNHGSWRLYGVDGGKATWAVYEFTLDLAGAIPSWLGRGRAGRDVVGLFQGVRDQTRYYRREAE